MAAAPSKTRRISIPTGGPMGPLFTGRWALGRLYDQNGVNASLLGRFIGARFGAPGDTAPLSPLFTMDFAAGYKLGKIDEVLRNTSIQLQVDNIANVTKIINFAGSTVGAGTPLYWTQPGGSVFVTCSPTR